MSPKNPRLTAGLTALGVFGSAALLAAGANDPDPTPGPPPAAATAPEAAPSTSTTVLLLYNGRLIQGQGPITLEGDAYVLRQRGGVIRFQKDQVEAAFGSMTELYRYKADQIPDRDPDERLKLARWCLTQRMKAEAREQLNAVLALSPDAREATAMLAALDAEAARLAAAPRVDPGVVQTGGEATTMRQPADRPAELDSTLLRAARKELGVTGLPVIFDLPQAIAVKRADEFARFVHPILQRTCVRCHNETYEGDFRLVEVKARRDATANVVRANLDATLQFINPEDPGRSDLLGLVLLPHGKAPSRRPIFSGSNDPAFQILASWVNRLRSAPKTDEVNTARFGGTREAAGGFATDRAGAAPEDTAPVGVGPSGAPGADVGGIRQYQFNPPEQLPATRLVPGKGIVVEKEPPAAGEFPLPFAAGGAPAPPPLPMPGDEGTRPAAGPPTPPSSAPPPRADLPPDAEVEAGKPEVPTGPPKRTFKLDPKLLERALMNRNGGR